MKLHIVIPTYNRSPLLSRTLAALAPLAGRFYLSIINNCSTDDTANIASEYVQAHPVNVTLINRPVNIGGMGNVLNAYIHGLERGEYLWILPDDDIISTVALADFISELDQQTELCSAYIVGECKTAEEALNWPPVWSDTKSGEFWRQVSFLPTVVIRNEIVAGGFKTTHWHRGGCFSFGGCYSHMLILKELANRKIGASRLRIVTRGGIDNPGLTKVDWLLEWGRVANVFEESTKAEIIKCIFGSAWHAPKKLAKATVQSKGGPFEIVFLHLSGIAPGKALGHFMLFMLHYVRYKLILKTGS